MSEDLFPIVVTHTGRQHADELLACWFYRVLYGEIRVVRSQDPRMWAHADVLLDVGAQYKPHHDRLDHHGASKVPMAPRERTSGYATAGLVWRLHGPLICERIMEDSYEGPWHDFADDLPRPQRKACFEFLAKILEHEIVEPVDAWDLGVYPPRQLAKSVLPFQWLLPHLEFDVAMEALGRAFTQRLRMLAETVAAEKLLESNLLLNGPSEFWVFDEWLVIRAPDGKRIEIKAAKSFSAKVVGMPLLAVLSSLRGGVRWGAFFPAPLPDSVKIPQDIEYAAGRRTLFHNSPMRLLAFLRECAASKCLHVPEIRVP